ncbi:MAG: oligosaccharide flippase family protein [Gaiellaceae bacterium]
MRATPGAEADGVPPVSPTEVPEKHVPGEKAVGQNTIETLLFRSLSTPIALLLVVIQSRFLAPEGRGTFVLVVLSVTIASRLLGQLGLAVTARMREQGADLRHLLLRAFALALVFGAVGAGLVVLSAGATEIPTDVALLAAAALVPNVIWQTVSGVLLGLARVRVWNLIQALSPILTLAAMLLFVVALDGGVRAAVAAWTLAHVLTAAFALLVSRHLWLPVSPAAFLDEHGRTLLRLALAMGGVQVINLIGYRAELFVLEFYDGVAAVGVYSIAMQAAEAMWLIPAAIATAITGPTVHDDEADARSLVSSSAWKSLLYTGAVALVVGASAPWVIPLLFGEDFDAAARPLALLLPGVVVYAPVTVLVVYLSVRHARPHLSLAVAVVAAVVTTALAILMIPRYGIEGAAAASAVGYGAGSVVAWTLFRRVGATS